MQYLIPVFTATLSLYCGSSVYAMNGGKSTPASSIPPSGGAAFMPPSSGTTVLPKPKRRIPGRLTSVTTTSSTPTFNPDALVKGATSAAKQALDRAGKAAEQEFITTLNQQQASPVNLAPLYPYFQAQGITARDYLEATREQKPESYMPALRQVLSRQGLTDGAAVEFILTAMAGASEQEMPQNISTLANSLKSKHIPAINHSIRREKEAPDTATLTRACEMISDLVIREPSLQGIQFQNHTFAAIFALHIALDDSGIKQHMDSDAFFTSLQSTATTYAQSRPTLQFKDLVADADRLSLTFTEITYILFALETLQHIDSEEQISPEQPLQQTLITALNSLWSKAEPEVQEAIAQLSLRVMNQNPLLAAASIHTGSSSSGAPVPMDTTPAPEECTFPWTEDSFKKTEMTNALRKNLTKIIALVESDFDSLLNKFTEQNFLGRGEIDSLRYSNMEKSNRAAQMVRGIHSWACSYVETLEKYLQTLYQNGPVFQELVQAVLEEYTNPTEESPATSEDLTFPWTGAQFNKRRANDALLHNHCKAIDAISTDFDYLLNKFAEANLLGIGEIKSLASSQEGHTARASAMVSSIHGSACLFGAQPLEMYLRILNERGPVFQQVVQDILEEYRNNPSQK